MIALLPAGLAALIAAVLAAAGFAGGWIVTAAAGLCVLSLAVGWGELLRVPHRSGTTLLVGVIGLVALVAGMLAVWPRTAVARPLSVFAAVLAAAILTSFGHELFRQDGRHDLVESITGTFAGQVVAILAAGWVLVAYTAPGSSAIVVAASAIAVARIFPALPIPGIGWWLNWIGVAAGVLTAVVAAMFVSQVAILTAALLGVAVSGVGIALDTVVSPAANSHQDSQPDSQQDSQRSPPRGIGLSVLAQAAAPLAAAGTVAYAVVRLGIG